MNDNPYDLTVQRAALPEVLLPSDIAVALGVSEREAERTAHAGRLGPSFLVAGRPALLRDSFLRHLADEGRTPPSREVLR